VAGFGPASGWWRGQEVYRIVRAAVESRRPISALYHNRHRLLCPHRLGGNKDGLPRVLCYQYGGESESGLKPVGSPDNWRCLAFDELRSVELLAGPWHTAPNHSRPASCIVDADVDADDYPVHQPEQGQ
jgi:hypothetical protein